MVFDVLFSCSFLSLGVKDADKNELGRIASDPTAEHVLYVEDFQLLPNVAPKLSRRLCFTASEPPRPVKQRVQGVSGFSLDPAFHLLRPPSGCASMGMNLPHPSEGLGCPRGATGSWSSSFFGTVLPGVFLMAASPWFV